MQILDPNGHPIKGKDGKPLAPINVSDTTNYTDILGSASSVYKYQLESICQGTTATTGIFPVYSSASH